jgi:hypothetical protein
MRTDRRTNFIPESIDIQVMESLVCIVPGNASQNARTRTSAKVRALRIMTASADAYNWLDVGK